MAAYERALELQPRLQPARLNLVRALLALGRNAEAERHANDAVAREPGSPERLVALACAQAAQGRLADAAAVLRKALALDSNCATALRAARLLEQRLAAGAGGGAGAALAGAQGHAGEPGKEE